MKRIQLLLLCLTATLTLHAAAPKINYTDATSLTVIGKALPTELAYNRIDTARYAIPQKAIVSCYMPAGIAVVFKTNSPLIKARWQTSEKTPGVNWSAIAQKGLDLYIRRDGQWVYAGVGKPRIDGKNNRHEDTLVNNMETGEKECLLFLPLYDRLDSLEIGVKEGYTLTPMENPFRHRIVVHGSSITHGASASRAGMAYPAQLERRTGLYCINLGFSGQCMLQPEFASYLADVEADAFIFDSFSNPSAAMIDERFGAFVDTIRRTHPKTPLIFMQTLVRETGNFDTRACKFEKDKREAAERQLRERMKSDPNLYFINPADLIGTDHNATADGIHPTDLGFDRMLKHIEPQILKILGKYGIR